MTSFVISNVCERSHNRLVWVEILQGKAFQNDIDFQSGLHLSFQSEWEESHVAIVRERFFDALRLRMTCILARDSSLRLRYVQNDKLVQKERGLTYALRDKIPMREKSRKEKVCIYISLVRKAVLSTEIVIENLLRCCKRTLFGIENHTFFFSQ